MTSPSKALPLRSTVGGAVKGRQEAATEKSESTIDLSGDGHLRSKRWTSIPDSANRRNIPEYTTLRTLHTLGSKIAMQYLALF